MCVIIETTFEIIKHRLAAAEQVATGVVYCSLPVLAGLCTGVL